nr:MAG TPA: hypothetical protein [Caudoviricetes sp.]
MLSAKLNAIGLMCIVCYPRFLIADNRIMDRKK